MCACEQRDLGKSPTKPLGPAAPAAPAPETARTLRSTCLSRSSTLPSLPAVFFIISCRKIGAIMVILSTLTLCFALLAGGVWSPRCQKAAGYVGALCGASAIYTAFGHLAKSELGYVMPGMSPMHFI